MTVSPCAFCGSPDQRHRMVDAQMEQVIAGDSIESVADSYDQTAVEMIAFWRGCYDAATEGWRNAIDAVADRSKPT